MRHTLHDTKTTKKNLPRIIYQSVFFFFHTASAALAQRGRLSSHSRNTPCESTGSSPFLCRPSLDTLTELPMAMPSAGKAVSCTSLSPAAPGESQVFGAERWRERRRLLRLVRVPPLEPPEAFLLLFPLKWWVILFVVERHVLAASGRRAMQDTTMMETANSVVAQTSFFIFIFL